MCSPPMLFYQQVCASLSLFFSLVFVCCCCWWWWWPWTLCLLCLNARHPHFRMPISHTNFMSSSTTIDRRSLSLHQTFFYQLDYFLCDLCATTIWCHCILILFSQWPTTCLFKVWTSSFLFNLALKENENIFIHFLQQKIFSISSTE